ncbi:hypothetical protein C7W93_00300 [Glaciimonas sp. PCH181]|nr:hypothetical protein C7W93_00300 [Glaciimonas sp. PCH181]
MAITLLHFALFHIELLSLVNFQTDAHIFIRAASEVRQVRASLCVENDLDAKLISGVCHTILIARHSTLVPQQIIKNASI